MGCRWRVGDGKTIDLWSDFWLPRRSNPNVLSPVLESLIDAKVEILIEESQRQWNHSLIDGIFTSDEAALIKSIPLSRVVKADSLFWPFTNNDVYTSQSSYQFLKREASNEHPLTDPQHEKDLWSFNVSNKVKNLLWRACRKSLPSKQNLMRRTIINCATCDRCKQETESAMHAMWACKELDVV